MNSSNFSFMNDIQVVELSECMEGDYIETLYYTALKAAYFLFTLHQMCVLGFGILPTHYSRRSLPTHSDQYISRRQCLPVFTNRKSTAENSNINKNNYGICLESCTITAAEDVANGVHNTNYDIFAIRIPFTYF